MPVWQLVLVCVAGFVILELVGGLLMGALLRARRLELERRQFLRGRR